MLNRLALPIICTAKHDCCTTWFACLKEMLDHPFLREQEKYLWLWLATQCANDNLLCVSYSYEQIANSMNKSCRFVHQSLFRLKLMGFLQVTLPIWYGEPTEEMRKEVRTMKLILPPKIDFERTDEENGVRRLPMHNVQKPIAINFIRNKIISEN